MGRELDKNRKLADYIYNDLSVEEIVEMEREISDDPQWADSYRLNVEVKEYLQAKLQLEEMRSDPQLKDAERLANLAFTSEPDGPLVEQPAINKSRASVSRKNRALRLTMVTALAASIALVLAFGILPSQLNEDRMFDRFYEPFAASDFQQRGSEQLYKEVAVGINLYKDGNYQQSIEQFSKLGSDPSVHSEVQFYSALSYLGLGQYTSAQELFRSLSAVENKYRAEALWYHGLSCLKTGDYEKAAVLFEELEKYNGLYQKDSQFLRRKLSRLTP